MLSQVAVPRKTNPKLVMRTKKIFVGGLSATTSLEDVKAYFEQFSKVKESMLAYDKVELQLPELRIASSLSVFRSLTDTAASGLSPSTTRTWWTKSVRSTSTRSTVSCAVLGAVSTIQ